MPVDAPGDIGIIDPGAIDVGAIDIGAVDSIAIDAGAIDSGAIDCVVIDDGAIDMGAIEAAVDGTVDGAREAAGELPAPPEHAATTNKPASDIAPIRVKRI